MAEAVTCFKAFDLNNSGSIGAEELAQVLKSLGHGEKEPEELRKMVRNVRSASQRVVGAEAKRDTDVKDAEGSAVSAVKDEVVPFDEVEARDNAQPAGGGGGGGGGVAAADGDEISLAEFVEWYKSSLFFREAQQHAIEEAEAEEGLNLTPPYGGGVSAWFWYIVLLPFTVCFKFTIPDVRVPSMTKYAAASFFMCLAWMGFFSYFMVSWAEVRVSRGAVWCLVSVVWRSVTSFLPVSCRACRRWAPPRASRRSSWA
jgi:hypothetical protein